MSRLLPPARPAVVVTATALLTLSACTHQAPTRDPDEPVAVTVLSASSAQTWDPQRISDPQDSAVARQTFARSLTGHVRDPQGRMRLTGDLAADTGTASADQRTWTFRLRSGVKWQDGSTVTCSDIKHGIARTFMPARPGEGGTGYAAALLDLPRRPDGTPTYRGPHDTGTASTAARKDFDEAVRCTGDRLVMRLAQPEADWGEIVSLPEFGPVKAGRDPGAGADLAPFSSGPYRLEGAWSERAGGTWVRNPHWSAATDPIRRAVPDRITLTAATEPAEALRRVLAPEANTPLVSLVPVPPALHQQVDSATDWHGSAATIDTSTTDYLALSVLTPRLRDPQVRRALALATDRSAYVAAIGGTEHATEVPSLLTAGQRVPASGNPIRPEGDPHAALAELRKAKVTTPVRITVAYRESPVTAKGLAALKGAWLRGGFDATLVPLGEDYYERMSEKDAARKYDAFWASWAPDYPAPGSVLPPLLDSSVNVTEDGSGRDYGQYSAKAVNDAMRHIPTVANADQRAREWAQLDRTLLADGAYIPLVRQRWTYLSGEGVTGVTGQASGTGYLDLGRLGVR